MVTMSLVTFVKNTITWWFARVWIPCQRIHPSGNALLPTTYPSWSEVCASPCNVSDVDFVSDGPRVMSVAVYSKVSSTLASCDKMQCCVSNVIVDFDMSMHALCLVKKSIPRIIFSSIGTVSIM